MRKNSRKKNQIRQISLSKNICGNAYGSVLFATGNTKVMCAASVERSVPFHAENKGIGWLSADYTLLPYSTPQRKDKEFLKRDSRSVEIKRLIGRSLRGVIDLSKMQNYSITVDCDVIQADGGTRTAAITGGYIALNLAINRMLEEKLIAENPLIEKVAAVSVGYVNDELLVDLDFSEDSSASVDMNIVMNSSYDLIEIQGTAEKHSYSLDQLNEMVTIAKPAIEELFKWQDGVVD